MSKTNLEKLPELHAKKASREANLRDILGAFKDKVKALRDQKDEATGKSVGMMIQEERKAITSLENEIVQAWKFPHQVNMDLGE